MVISQAVTRPSTSDDELDASDGQKTAGQVQDIEADRDTITR
jgi:hypothetical protein